MVDTDRVVKRKRIFDPNDSTHFVDIPVAYEIHFRVAAEQSQDRIIYHNNSAQSSRKIHVKRVNSSKPGDEDQYVDVERVDSFNVRTMAEQAQDYTFYLINKDPPPKQQDGSDDPAHEKVRYIRYYHNNDPSAQSWITIEIIDRANLISPTEQYQGYDVYLLNPDPGDPVPDPDDPFGAKIAYCDPGLDEAPDDSGNGIDPPYRIDPWQNVVDVHWGHTTHVTGPLGWLRLVPYPAGGATGLISIAEGQVWDPTRNFVVGAFGGIGFNFPIPPPDPGPTTDYSASYCQRGSFGPSGPEVSGDKWWYVETADVSTASGLSLWYQPHSHGTA